jgi:hypothetical protein
MSPRALALLLAAGVAASCARVPEPPPPVPADAPASADEPDLHPRPGAEPPRVPPALPPVVERRPGEVREGAPVLVVLRPQPGSAPIAHVAGTLGHRPIAFAAGPDGAFWTVVPAPVGARELALRWTVAYVGGAERGEEHVWPVARREFPSEVLHVARRFTRPPAAVEARIEEERRLVQEVLRQVTPEPLWTEPFALPREDRFTSVFGTARVFNGEIQSRHWGDDIAGRPGDPVAAANRGRVALARELYFSGNSVYVDHGLGLYTAYFHLSEILVREGELVEKGQILGRVGATGRVTGPHLHWSANWQGIPVEPRALLELGAPPAATAPGADPR